MLPMRSSKLKIQNLKFKTFAFATLSVLFVTMTGCNKSSSSAIPNDAIGIVGKHKLSLKTYQWKLKSGAEALGVDPATSAGNRDFEELREGIVSNMIDSVLIEDELATRNQGKVVSKGAIDEAEKKEIAKIGSEAEYENYLKKYSLTRTDYKEILRSLLAENMLREELALFAQITDKEIEDYYKEHSKEMVASENSKTPPTLEQAKPEIINNLRAAHAKQRLADLVKELRKKASVTLKEEYRFGKLKTEFPN